MELPAGKSIALTNVAAMGASAGACVTGRQNDRSLAERVIPIFAVGTVRKPKQRLSMEFSEAKSFLSSRIIGWILVAVISSTIAATEMALYITKIIDQRMVCVEK
ncbi:hypothetical protein ACIQW9_04420 [Herminiimonas sp. NPDC097707]|uniref:hypothetical protein n=1 Tax=Herminiimonas sp. NPDC097707 TaxID=3364007 RepID=UPI00383BDB1C